MNWQPFNDYTVLADTGATSGVLLVERLSDGKRAIVGYSLDRAQLTHGNRFARISDGGLRCVVDRWYSPRYANRLYADVSSIYRAN